MVPLTQVNIQRYLNMISNTYVIEERPLNKDYIISEDNIIIITA